MKKIRIKKKYIYTTVAVVVGILYLLLVGLYRKYTADWYGINIFYCTGPLVAIVMFVFSQLEWFQYGGSAPNKMVVIVVVGLVLNVLVGILVTEPSYPESQQSNINYDSGGSQGDSVFFLANLMDSGFDVDTGDSIEGLAILFLVILIIALLVGSIFIPHFWVVSGGVLVSILAMLAVREFMVIEEPQTESSYYTGEELRDLGEVLKESEQWYSEQGTYLSYEEQNKENK